MILRFSFKDCSVRSRFRYYDYRLFKDSITSTKASSFGFAFLLIYALRSLLYNAWKAIDGFAIEHLCKSFSDFSIIKYKLKDIQGSSSSMNGMSGSNSPCWAPGRLTQGRRLFKNRLKGFWFMFRTCPWGGPICWLSWILLRSILSTLSLKLFLLIFEYLDKLKGIGMAFASYKHRF